MDVVGPVEWTASAINAQTAGRGKILGGSEPDAGFRPNGRTARAPALQGTTGRGESRGAQRGLRRGRSARRPRRGTAGATGPRGGDGSATARTPASSCAQKEEGERADRARAWSSPRCERRGPIVVVGDEVAAEIDGGGGSSLGGVHGSGGSATGHGVATAALGFREGCGAQG